MVKKSYFITLFALLGSIAFGMLITSQDLLKHIKTEMISIKRAWNVSRAQIKQAEQKQPALYAKLKPVFDQIIAKEEFRQKVDAIVDEQYTSITSNLMAYSQVTKDLSFNDFFPNATIGTFGKELFASMVRKHTRLKLAEKLMAKIRELQKNITLERSQDSEPQE